jgi:hypothetical protein
MTNRRGISTIVIVILILALCLILLSILASQAMLVIERNRSTTDSALTNYASESQVNDLLSRLINYGATPGSTSFTLPDGTKVTITITGTNPQDITIITSRPGATNIVKAKREYVSPQNIPPTYITLALDCTNSMGDPACSDGSCTGTRMDKLKTALLNFLTNIETFITDPSHASAAGRIRIGISVFGLTPQWLNSSYDGLGNPTGTNIDLSTAINSSSDIQTIKNVVTANFTSDGASSPACKKAYGSYTSVGSGVDFMNTALKAKIASETNPDAKFIEILITDGEPNQRTPSLQWQSGGAAHCPTAADIFCPQDGSFCNNASTNTNWPCPKGVGGSCMTYARDYLRCTLAKTNQFFDAEGLAFSSTKSNLAFEENVAQVLGLLAQAEPTTTPIPTNTPTPAPTSPTTT